MKLNKRDLMFPNKAVFSLVWPIAIEGGLNTAIGLVNSLMVSSIGLAAVSAVSLVDSINLLFMNIFNAFAAGVTVVVSHCMGRNDKKGADEALTQTFTVLLLVSSLAGLLVLIFNRQVLGLMFGKADADVMSSAIIYNIGSVVSYPFIASFSICAGALRATGDSRTPMMAALASNIINVGIGALTIMVLDWGMVGAACAMLCARVTSALILYIKLAFKPGIVSIKRISLKLQKEVLMPVVRVGLPAGIDSLVFNGGKLVVTSFMTGMGTDALAANSIANTMVNFSLVTGSAFSNAGVTITGRCFGAKLYDEAKLHLRRLPIISSVCYGITMVVVWLCMPSLVALYNATPLAAEYIRTILLICLIGGTLTWSVSFMLPNCLRGVGDINFNTVVSIISMWVFRVGGGYILGVVMGYQVVGVWIAAVCGDWAFRGICYVSRMLSNKWYKKAITKDESEEAAALTAAL